MMMKIPIMKVNLEIKICLKIENQLGQLVGKYNYKRFNYLRIGTEKRNIFGIEIKRNVGPGPAKYDVTNGINHVKNYYILWY
jgi:hypothetical protein